MIFEESQCADQERTSYIDHSLGPDGALQYGFHGEIQLARRKKYRVEVLEERERKSIIETFGSIKSWPDGGRLVVYDKIIYDLAYTTSSRDAGRIKFDGMIQLHDPQLIIDPKFWYKNRLQSSNTAN